MYYQQQQQPTIQYRPHPNNNNILAPVLVNQQGQQVNGNINIGQYPFLWAHNRQAVDQQTAQALMNGSRNQQPMNGFQQQPMMGGFQQPAGQMSNVGGYQNSTNTMSQASIAIPVNNQPFNNTQRPNNMEQAGNYQPAQIQPTATPAQPVAEPTPTMDSTSKPIIRNIVPNYPYAYNINKQVPLLIYNKATNKHTYILVNFDKETFMNIEDHIDMSAIERKRELLSNLDNVTKSSDEQEAPVKAKVTKHYDFKVMGNIIDIEELDNLINSEVVYNEVITAITYRLMKEQSSSKKNLAVFNVKPDISLMIMFTDDLNEDELKQLDSDILEITDGFMDGYDRTKKLLSVISRTDKYNYGRDVIKQQIEQVFRITKLALDAKFTWDDAVSDFDGVINAFGEENKDKISQLLTQMPVFNDTQNVLVEVDYMKDEFRALQNKTINSIAIAPIDDIYHEGAIVESVAPDLYDLAMTALNNDSTRLKVHTLKQILDIDIFHNPFTGNKSIYLTKAIKR